MSQASGLMAQGGSSLPKHTVRPGTAVHRHHPVGWPSTSSTRAPLLGAQYLVETWAAACPLDYDNDGRLDVFFTNGAKIDEPCRTVTRTISPTVDSGIGSTIRTRTAGSAT